jgi:hypothetical protein
MYITSVQSEEQFLLYVVVTFNISGFFDSCSLFLRLSKHNLLSRFYEGYEAYIFYDKNLGTVPPEDVVCHGNSL